MNTEPVSVVVVSRDRFSTTTACLEALLAHTDPSSVFITVIGGAPKKVKQDLTRRFGDKIQFIFQPDFLNPAQARNIGLRATKTRLAVLMDNDVLVRPDWLAPLIRCQVETGAAMVVPIVLEGIRTIHTAGNDLYISYKNGKAYGRKELRYLHMEVDERTNLERRPTDYGELHCQLVDAPVALKLGVYDENIREVGEVDAGLTWKKAGCKMFFEPASIVFYDIPLRISHPEDIRFFAWRWDMRAILEGYRYFEKKWGMDISDQGTFQDFLVGANSKLGLWPRLFPSRTAFFLDRICVFIGELYQKPVHAWRRMKAHLWGYGEWEREYRK